MPLQDWFRWLCGQELHAAAPPLIAIERNLTLHDIIRKRWQHLYQYILTSFLNSGRKCRCSGHLFLGQWLELLKDLTESLTDRPETLILQTFCRSADTNMRHRSAHSPPLPQTVTSVLCLCPTSLSSLSRFFLLLLSAVCWSGVSRL